MSSTQQSVTRLDLAPQFKHLLSIWNPLNYFQLLYLIFFFPQALPSYILFVKQKFVDKKCRNWRYLWGLLDYPFEYEILLQGGILASIIFLLKGEKIVTIFTLLTIVYLIFSISLLLSYFLKLKNKSAFKEIVNFNEERANSLILIAYVWIFGNNYLGSLLEGDIHPHNNLLFFIVKYSAIHGFLAGTLYNLTIAIFSELHLVNFKYLSHYKFFQISLSICLSTISIPISYMFTNKVINEFNKLSIIIFIFIFIISIATFILSSILASFRLDNFILHLLLYKHNNRNICNVCLPRVTPIPIPHLTYKIKKWMLQDWEIGIYNSKQIFKYTLQSQSVLNALKQVLNEKPLDQVVTCIVQLAEPPYTWELLGSLSGYSPLETLPQSYTPVQATAAGLWFLHEKMPIKAIEAFAIIRSLPCGEEMFVIAQSIAIFYESKNVDDIANLQIPTFPREPQLRLTTWKALTSLKEIAADIQIIYYSSSRSARAFALSRAFGELKKLRDNPDYIQEPERKLIKKIVFNWSEAILNIAIEVGQVKIKKLLNNPYVIGDPVEGNLFVGRDDTITQLEQILVVSNKLQSVVLFGHRRMGKTSILRNISTRLDGKVKLAYVNLLTVGNSVQGVGEVLMAIADSLSDTLQILPPDDDSLINLPYRTFERYLKQIETQLGDTGLIIALDEFEQIEELIKSDRIPKDFMGVLRGMVQMSPKIAFALAGLHTLEEMTEDYFNPFFASIIPIRVSFLERATCRYLLANPSEDFPLDYKPDALDYIYDLTAGQPYLVQLIGFLLVRRYNDQVFELGNNRDPMFTIADVDGIINQPEFYQNGRYYFTGVWQQAGEGSPGQQQIIKALAPGWASPIAPHPTGLDFNTLQSITNLDATSLQNALDTLARHDVIQQTDDHWRIIVELFRRWVVNHHPI